MAKPERPRQEVIPGSQPLFDEFEIGLARAAAESNPANAMALQMLGGALTRARRHHEALDVDLRLAGLRPKDAIVQYNLACSYSLLKDVDSAFDALHRAFKLGYNDYRHMLRDPDLSNARKDQRFRALLNKKWGRRQP